MSTRRQSGKEQFWRSTVQRWRRSGMSVRAFCEAHRLAQATFYAWRRNLTEQPAKAVRFVPVQVRPEVTVRCGGDEALDALELILDGRHRLQVRPGFDADTLQRLLALLEEGRP